MLFFFIIIYNINLLGNKHCMIHIKEKKKRKEKTNKQTNIVWCVLAGKKNMGNKSYPYKFNKRREWGQGKKKIKRREVEIYHCCEEVKERIDDESSGLGESKKSRSFLSFQLSQNFHPSFLSISEKSFVWT